MFRAVAQLFGRHSNAPKMMLKTPSSSSTTTTTATTTTTTSATRMPPPRTAPQTRPQGTVLDNFPLCAQPQRAPSPEAQRALAAALGAPRATILAIVALASRLLLHVWCRTQPHHIGRLVNVLTDPRYCHRPVLTIANHASTLDDPVLFGILPLRVVLSAARMRWCLGAKELCFASRVTAFVCGAGRVIPITRGEGIYQPGMDLALKKLNSGGWVHLFPEGFVSQDMRSIKMFRWGVARLILDCNTAPIVVPFYHEGLNNVMPLDPAPLIPHFGKRISVFVGTPIDLRAHRLVCHPPALFAHDPMPYGSIPTAAQRLNNISHVSDDDAIDADARDLRASLLNTAAKSVRRCADRDSPLDLERDQRIALSSFLQRKLANVLIEAKRVITT